MLHNLLAGETLRRFECQHSFDEIHEGGAVQVGWLVLKHLLPEDLCLFVLEQPIVWIRHSRLEKGRVGRKHDKQHDSSSE